MISRKSSSSIVLAVALTGAALACLTGCPDNSSTKPGTTPAASSAPAANTPAPAATPAASAKGGSGW
jgi:hypothetical protein